MPALRARLGEAALTLARAVGYVSAGTCEFLLDDRGGRLFLEMNTRLQVEHPVTELVTGRDLVADQLRDRRRRARSASTRPTSRPGGHAVEVRLYAEDAEDGFLPATGRVEALRWPAGDGRPGRCRDRARRRDRRPVRPDAGQDHRLGAGPAGGARAARASALDATVVLGLVTNLRFLRWLVRQPVVLARRRPGPTPSTASGRRTTVGRTKAPPSSRPQPVLADLRGRGRCIDRVAARARSPIRGPAAGGSTRRHRSGSSRRRCPIRRRGRATLPPTSPAGRVLASRSRRRHRPFDVAGRSVAFRLAPPPDVDAAARAAAIAMRRLGRADRSTSVAPMPGAVLTVHAAGARPVEAGDPIVTLEAMKMEHVVAAPIAGRRRGLVVRAADQVTRGQLLAVIEP